MDPSVRHTIASHLSAQNMRSSTAGNRKDMLRVLSADDPDIVVLDLDSGQEDGLDTLRELRTVSMVPVILTTEHRNEEVDQIVGFELGADDYMKKPLQLRELSARLRALLRRRHLERTTAHRTRDRLKYVFEGWMFEPRSRLLRSPSGRDVSLTKGEFGLLVAFVTSPQRTLSREQLLHATRVHENILDRSIDVQVLRLRRKLQIDPDMPSFIRTERGAGYVFVPAVRFHDESADFHGHSWR